MPEIIIDARRAAISEKMEVRRILPFRSKRMVGPFIFMDHAGPVNFKTGEAPSMDVLPHPHIGLSTVTYLFGGKVTHRDSLGVRQEILPGEVNWMTAGSGISHSERFEDAQALVNGIEMMQTWVALPERDEETTPAFKNHKAADLPLFDDNGVWYRLIAGEYGGLRSPVITNSPLIYMHIELGLGAELIVPNNYAERGVYIVRGELELSGNKYQQGQLIVFSKGEEPKIIAKKASTLMLLGGESLGHRHIWWNFVSSRKERIEQAKEDWRAGRILLPPTDNLEFVPLPEDKRPGSQENPSPQMLS